MIDGVGKSGPARIEPSRGTAGASAPARAGEALSQPKSGAAAGSALSDLISAGPPIDADKVAAIRAAIAEGRYPVDADKIAERMIEMDLPQRP